MDHNVRINLTSASIVAAIGIAVSLITSTIVASRAYQARGEQRSKEERTILVKGSARTQVTSDLAVSRIRVDGSGDEMKSAYEVLERSVDLVGRFVTANGFMAEEVDLGAIQTETHHRRDKEGRDLDEVSGYTLRRWLTVTTSQVDRVASAAGEVTQLYDDVKVTSSQPEFLYTRIADMKVKILGEASRDARNRANEIAANSGCRVSDVRDAQMGVIQITRPNSTEVSGYGVYDTDTIEKDVSVVVTLRFGLDSGGPTVSPVISGP